MAAASPTASQSPCWTARPNDETFVSFLRRASPHLYSCLANPSRSRRSRLHYHRKRMDLPRRENEVKQSFLLLLNPLEWLCVALMMNGVK
eukprot:scaffold26767_cov78-Skeletonema_dohrnii-CCMP3373.AAC.2